MKEKIKNFLKRAIIKLKSPFFEILLGIVVISVICVVSYNFNKKELSYAMEQTSIYLEKQCLSFNRYDDAAVTRGIIRIIENVQQIVRNIDLRKSVTDKDLERYTFEQRLTGSFVLDEKNNIVCEYSSDYEDIENLKKEFGFDDEDIRVLATAIFNHHNRELLDNNKQRIEFNRLNKIVNEDLKYNVEKYNEIYNKILENIFKLRYTNKNQ